MSILKNLKKKQKTLSVQELAKTMANVKKLIDMKALQVDLEQPKFSIYPELWIGKDQKFKNNFCKNVLIWWSFNTSNKDAAITLEIFEMDSAKKLGQYNEKTGFISL